MSIELNGPRVLVATFKVTATTFKVTEKTFKVSVLSG